MRIAWLRDLRPEFHTNVQRSIFFTWPQTTGSNLHNKLPGLIESHHQSQPIATGQIGIHAGYFSSPHLTAAP